jgi:hypothetical protein
MFFAFFAKLAILRDFFLAIWAKLKREERDFINAFIAKPNIFFLADQTGDGEKGIKKKSIQFLRIGSYFFDGGFILEIF